MRIFVLCFLEMVCCSWAQADGAADSLRQVWTNEVVPDTLRFEAMNAFYVSFTHRFPDSSLALTEQHYQLASQIGNHNERAKALNERAIAFSTLGISDSILPTLHRALAIRALQNDSIGIAKLYANIGTVFRQQSQYRQAVRYYTLSLGIFNRTETQWAAKADLTNNLGLVYEDVKLYDLALAYLNEALELYTQAGLADRLGNIWLNLGSIHFYQGKVDFALPYYRKALDLFEAEQNIFSASDGYHMLALAYQQLGQEDTALHYLEKGLALNQQIGNTRQNVSSLILKANLLLEKEPRLATEIGQGVLSMVLEGDDLNHKASVYELLHRCYKKLGLTDRSLGMLEKHVTYADSVRIQEDRITLVRETMQNEFEAKLLNTQLANEKKAAELKRNQGRKLFAFGGVGLLIVLALAFYARSRSVVHRREREDLLAEIAQLKTTDDSPVPMYGNGFQLDRDRIEQTLERNLNETDWTVLNILLADPVISNKGIAEQAFLSVDGIGSSLRRMYVAFDIRESKYKKISLLMEAIKRSNH